MKPHTIRQEITHQSGWYDWDRLIARLQWLYGPERAETILDETDGPTRADVAAWKRLGRGRMTRRWEAGEIAEMRRLAGEKVHPAEIAKRLLRSHVAVKVQMKRCGIENQSPHASCWNKHGDDVLRAGAQSGKSFSEVGAQLGKTRNAIAGRAHRLGVPFNCDRQQELAREARRP